MPTEVQILLPPPFVGLAELVYAGDLKSPDLMVLRVRLPHPTPRGLAQFGRAFALGAKGRRFKSCIPDHFFIEDI